MRRLTRLGFFACAVAAGCSSAQRGTALGTARTPASEAARTPDARAILRALTERYGTAKTYEDHGLQRSVVRSDGNAVAFENRTKFRTAFERSTGAFFFGYEQTVTPAFHGPTRGVIWRGDSELARSWWTVKDDVRESTLESAIAGFTGVSGGTAYIVPSMLIHFGDDPLRDARVDIVGEEIVAGVRCVKMFAREAEAEREITLWVTVAPPALRRIRERSRIVREALTYEEAERKVPPSAPEHTRIFIIEDYMRPSSILTESTTDYAPVFDRPIARTRFEFTPPGAP